MPERTPTMLSLTDRASLASTLDDPDLDPDLDLDLRVLIGRHLSDDTKLFVVQAGDTPEVINDALGFPITGEKAEEPGFKWILDHGRWFEILYDRGDAVHTRILVENNAGTELGIHYLCLSNLWPRGEGGGL